MTKNTDRRVKNPFSLEDARAHLNKRDLIRRIEQSITSAAVLPNCFINTAAAHATTHSRINATRPMVKNRTNKSTVCRCAKSLHSVLKVAIYYQELLSERCNCRGQEK